jgi:hypothetical protein
LEDSRGDERLVVDSRSRTERRTPVEEPEKRSPAEPESDVEAHKKKSVMATDEPKADGESDDDVEAHKKKSVL